MNPQIEIAREEVKSSKQNLKELNWYLTPVFLLAWVVLFFAVVRPIYFSLPNANTIETERLHQGQFIAERAQQILYDYGKIGYKLVGSYENENKTVMLILDELAKIELNLNKELYNLEIDLQVVSGNWFHNNVHEVYNKLQNVVVKLSDKRSESENFLLLNSHFDSKPLSPGKKFCSV